ncbi:MAG: DUF4349 domain-containing protein [Bacteroidota bacterium]
MTISIIRKTAWIFLAGFVLMFGFRLWYGFTLTLPDNFAPQSQNFFNSLVQNRNFATKRYKVNSSLSGESIPSEMSQKYEKVAHVGARSSTFDKTEQNLRKVLESHEVVIQFEQKRGNAGNQQLNLTLGVHPDKFDQVYQLLITQFGKVTQKDITKKDKTNEYSQLQSQKASLMKYLLSLKELKSKGGNIEEYIQLENKILQVEEQLQQLGVQLGNFDAEHEFCTIMYSLAEYQKTEVSLMHRIKVALEWTIGKYLMLSLVFALLAGALSGVTYMIRSLKSGKST